MARNIVFVYGTLMSGCGNHGRISSSPQSQLICKGLTVSHYCMFAAGVPFVDPDLQRARIHGEIWVVDDETLASLDQLEGHPDWYYREQIAIEAMSELTPAIRTLLGDAFMEGQVTAGIYFNRKFRELGMDEEAIVIETGNFLDSPGLSTDGHN